MHDIHLVLKNLTAHFDADNASADEIRQTFSNQLPPHLDLSVLINNLTEICTECRQTRESNVFDNSHDSWEYFTKIISVEHLLAFFTGIIEFAEKEPTNFVLRKVALTIGRTYVLLLTSPGAKIFGAFQTDLLQKVFKVFGVIKHLGDFRDHERVQLQMIVTLLLEDFHLYLKHVSFEEYEELQTQFVESIAAIMEFHHEKGYLNKYSFQIQELCYGTLEYTCLPIHNADITASMAIVLNSTACLTRFHRPCAGSASKPKYALITDWFIDMLQHYPRQTSAILNCYIQAILTDSDITANRDLLSRYLDICTQYDAAMVRICGESISDFLQQLALSKESQHRVNCVELISRMLQLNTSCDWELFRHELPKIPREITLIKILIQKFYDSNNVVTLKAINAFLKVASDGNVVCKEIFLKCFYDPLSTDEATTSTDNHAVDLDGINESIDLEKANQEKEKEQENQQSHNNNDKEARTDDESGSEMGSSSRSQTTEVVVDYTKSPEFKGLVREIQDNLLLAVGLQLKNPSALVRRVVVLLLEFLGTTHLGIDHLLTSYELRQLYIDQSTLVRRQLVLSLDKILNSKPTNEAAIAAWIKIILDLANDIDQKVMETVIESFKRNIFDKIEIYEKSPSQTHCFPWRLLKSMLNCRDSPDFRISVQKWMNRNLLNAKTLSKIETHLDTNNATEAWILLAIVSPNIQGHNPERVSKLLLSNLKYDMTNTVENCYIQLEVLSFWLKYLNNPSKNEIKRLMTETLVTGSLRPRNINRAFGICYKLSIESGGKDRRAFIARIRTACETYISQNKNSMFVQNLCDDRFISYVYLYSEVASVLESTLESEIVDFFFEFLHVAGEGKVLTLTNDSELPEKINCILSVLTGMSSFSIEICSRFVPHLGKILRTVDHSDVSFTAIKCLGYLCKKNTAVVEAIVPYILMKTQHRYSSIREFAFKTLATLILEDYLKFRGTLLIYILAGILDQEREIKELAIELIMKYTLEKSEIFLRTCLMEVPFVFNGSPCFGQAIAGLSQSGNILKGAAKKNAREFIYQYLIRKIEPVYLYTYFGHFTRLLDYIQKEEQTISKSTDLQASIADFLFVCSEICIANEKNKKNLEKIVKESHTGEGLELNDGDEMPTEKEADAGESAKPGRRGKKNQPTLSQALQAVEKIVPAIASIDEYLRKMNANRFDTVIDKLCTNMCVHFESLIEYAQPREFWAKYLDKAKKINQAATTSKAAAKKSAAAAAKAASAAETIVPESPSTSKSKPSRSNPEENDSGQFTMDDDELSKRSVSQASTKEKNQQSIASDTDNDSDNNETVFSEITETSAVSRKRKSEPKQSTSTNKRAKNSSETPTRKSSRR